MTVCGSWRMVMVRCTSSGWFDFTFRDGIRVGVRARLLRG